MALKTQIVDIPLSGGVDTKSDDKQVQIGKNLKLENMVMQKTGSVSKRHGYVNKGTGTTLSGQSISVGYSLYDYNGTLLLWGKDTGAVSGVPNDNGFFTFAPQLNQWQNVGRQSPVEFDIDRISQPDPDIVGSDMAVGSGYSVYFYKISGIARAEVFETNSETPFIFANTIAPGTSPKIFYISDLNNVNEVFVGIGADTANTRLEKWTWDPATPTTAGTTGTLVSDVHVDGVWDAAKIEFDGYEEIVVAHKKSSDGEIAVNKYDAAGAVSGSPIATVSITVTNSPAGAMCIVPILNSAGDSQRLLLIYQNESDDKIYAYSLNTNLAVMTGPVELTNDTVGFTAYNITAAADYKENTRTGEDCVRYWVELEDTAQLDGYNHTVFTGLTSFEAANISGGTITGRQHAALAGKAFSFENSAYVLEVYDDDLQPTYFLTSMAYNAVTQDYLRVHAKILRNRAGPVQQGLSSAVKTATGRYSYSLMRRDRLLSDGVVTKSVQAVNINMQPDTMPSVSVNRSLYIGGGVLTSFDNRAHELGHHLFPGKPEIDYVSTGGKIAAGTYSYKLVYEWTDNQGNLHRSAPSAPKALIISGTDTNTVTISAISMAYSFVGAYKSPKIYAYRTEASGTNYYKIDNDPVTLSWADPDGIIPITDTTSDANLINNELLYTTGGVLETSSAPATKIMVARKDRVFLVPMDDPFTVQYSKPSIEGVAIEFSDALVSRIDVDGPNTALGILDNKVIVFKERSIYYFAGEGPNALGQSGFSPILKIQTDVGCVNQKSVVDIGIGLMFKSRKGIYIIDRSLQVSYIGAAVEEWNSFDVKSANLVRDLNQVRFVLSGGQGVLVYDYFHNQWSRFTNHPAVDATINDGKYSWIKSDGTVKIQTTLYRDVNFTIPFKIRTPWVKLQSLQGYQRVKRASIIGDFRSHHTLNIKVFTDYDDITAKQEVNYVTTGNQKNDDPMQVEVHMKQQKCQSIMFEITDKTLKGSLESARLSKITLDIGIKEGTNKLPDGKTK